MALKMLLMCACLISAASAFTMEFVPEVRQNFEDKSNSDLVNQMAAFQRASLVYMAYASFFGRSNVHLPGFRKFFKAASEASLKDAQKVIDYINIRGGHQQFPLIDMNAACRMTRVPREKSSTEERAPPICDLLMKKDPLKDKKKFSYSGFFFGGQKQSDAQQQSTNETWRYGLQGLQDSLLLERALNSQLLDLAKGAATRGDKHLRHTVEDSFLTQQTTRIKKLADVITRLRQYAEQEYPLGEYVIDLEMNS